MKKQFKTISLLTLFTIVLNMLAVLVFITPAKAATTTSDTMTRQRAGVAATHTFTITSTVTNITSIVITIDVTGQPATGFAGTPAGTVTGGTCSWSSPDLTCTASTTFTSPITDLAVTGLTNPTTVGQYDFLVDVVGDTSELNNPASVYIVDSDQVNINGYISTSIMFDIDTDNANGDCAYNVCLTHGTGSAGTNYTVDLGNLLVARYNKSGDEVLHSDGNVGEINYIWFDLATNAYGGAVVTYLSSNGLLDGPGSVTYDIPSVTDGDSLVAGTAAYGIKFNDSFAATATIGTLNESAGGGVCENDDVNTWCDVTTSTQTLFDSNSAPVEAGRASIQVGASIDGTMPPGTYNDTLTFIATATF